MPFAAVELWHLVHHSDIENSVDRGSVQQIRAGICRDLDAGIEVQHVEQNTQIEREPLIHVIEYPGRCFVHPLVLPFLSVGGWVEAAEAVPLPACSGSCQARPGAASGWCCR